MLCKVDDATISISDTVSFQSENQTLAAQPFYNGGSDVNSRIFDDVVAEIPSRFSSGTLSISVPYTMDKYTCAIGTAKNGTFQNDGIVGIAYGTKTFTFSKTATGGDVWRMYGKVTENGYIAYVSRSNYITATFTGTITLHKLWSMSGKPRELKQITEKATITIFGLHINNTWLKDTPASYGEFVKFCNKLGNKQTINAPYNTAYTSNKYGILRGNFTSGTNVQIKINDLEIFNASLTSANQITIPPITIAPGDIIFVYGNGTNNCYIDLFG